MRAESPRRDVLARDREQRGVDVGPIEVLVEAHRGGREGLDADVRIGLRVVEEAFQEGGELAAGQIGAAWTHRDRKYHGVFAGR